MVSPSDNLSSFLQESTTVLGLAEGEEDEDEPFGRGGVGTVKPWQPACASIILWGGCSKVNSIKKSHI